jgi:guanylate kinase
VKAPGNIFVVSSPSGGGKTSVISRVLDAVPRLALSVSHTSRPPRKGERNGRDYRFVSREEFVEMQGREEFAEWVRLHGHLYGTSRQELERITEGGRDIILDIDVRGADKVRELFPRAVTVFLLPPSMEILEQRLRKRGSESEVQVETRLKRAVREMRAATRYRYCIVNRSLAKAADQLGAVVIAERLHHPPEVLRDLLRSIVTSAK